MRLDDQELTDQLKALRFVDQRGDPTVLGLLVISTDPPAFIVGVSSSSASRESSWPTHPQPEEGAWSSIREMKI